MCEFACVCVCVSVRERERERRREIEIERGKVRGGAWFGEERGRRRERGLDDDSVCRSCGSSVDGARSSCVQTHEADAPCEIWEKETRGQREMGGGEEEEV